MITVIIPVYKNKKDFLNILQINLRYLDKEEVIIVNDDPSTLLKDNLRLYPQVTLINNERNLGFGESVNKGVENAKQKYVMLLNSDTKLINASFRSALEEFQNNRQLFAIAFSQKEKGGIVVGKNKLYWKNGFILHKRASDLKYGYNAWAEGGACMIDKEKFMELGGFDPLYSPFYWEDIDLSYRAWKSGYQIVFDPKIVVEHYHESTIGKYFPNKKIKQIAYRNQFLFCWKNITDQDLILKHVASIMPNLFKSFIKGDFLFIQGFLEAFKSLNTILMKRKQIKNKLVKPDSEILRIFYE